MSDQQTNIPAIAKEAVLTASQKIADDTPIVVGYDFNAGINYDALLGSYLNSGFQATNFGKAVQEINKMVRHLEHASPQDIYLTQNTRTHSWTVARSS